MSKSKSQDKRTAVWYLKFLFACYAVSFAVTLLVFLVSLPFAGYALIDWWYDSHLCGLVMLGLAVAASPFVYKRLR